MDVEVRGIYKAPPFYPLLGSVTITTQSTSTSSTSGRATSSRSSTSGRAGRREDGRARVGGRRLSRREGAVARGVDRPAGRGLQPVPDHAVRPARAVRDHQPVRDGQHARALGLRADARARHAARRRDDAAPGPADGAPRERHHRAHRGRARASTRDLPRRARDAGAGGVRRPVRGSGRPADRAGVLAIIVGIFAAIAPARRAARLDPLQALQYE